jgi:hypothetical protein
MVIDFAPFLWYFSTCNHSPEGTVPSANLDSDWFAQTKLNRTRRLLADTIYYHALADIFQYATFMESS